ncbi:MAG: hypothetical protein ABI813_08480 [Bacteroidota bacterium]
MGQEFLIPLFVGDSHATGNTAQARTFYEIACRLTKSDAEKKILQRKIAQLLYGLLPHPVINDRGDVFT